jgi:hypothetical protein
MPDQTPKSTSLAESISGEAQPHQPNHEISLRLRRNRPSPDNDTTPRPHRIATSRRRRSLSIRSDSCGPHRRASRNRPAAMPSSSTSTHSGLISTKFTKTGRVSKAKKGVKGAHICTCGKVSFPNLIRRFQRLVRKVCGQSCGFCASFRVLNIRVPSNTAQPLSSIKKLTCLQVYSRAEHLRCVDLNNLSLWFTN